MKNTLMILAHPNLEASIGNKIISESVAQFSNAEVRDLTKLYPDFKINVEAEQQALLKADLIIFQYPLYWLATPAILKEWIDKVLTYGFAFGEGSYNLEGKKIMCSYTTGSSKDGYTSDFIKQTVFPFQGTADFCKMEYLTTMTCHGIMYMPGADKTPLEEIAKEYSGRLTAFIESLN